MTLPVGVETRTVTIRVPIDVLGTDAKAFSGTVRPDRALVWSTTGEPIWPVPAVLPAPVDGLITFDVPIVDQSGMVDAAGSPVTNWAYRVQVTGTWSGAMRTTSKAFQVFDADVSPVEVDLAIDAGMVPPVVDPDPYVQSVAGNTGVVTAEMIAEAALAGGGGVPDTRTVGAGSGLSGGGDLSADRTLVLDQEFVRDLIAGFVVAGASITVTHNDAGDTLTIAATGLASATGGGREAKAALTGTTGTCTGDLSAASVFTISPTGNFTLALSNVPASGTACTVTVIISQGATPRTLTMPSGTTWLQTAPTQAANKVCVVTLLTVDGGTTWLATAVVQP